MSPTRTRTQTRPGPDQTQTRTWTRPNPDTDPDPDDAAAFRRYAILLHEYVHESGTLFISKNVPTSREKRDEYRSMPRWERTAALFINFPHTVLDGVDHRG